LIGVSQPTVTRHRNRLGIAPCKHPFLTKEGRAANYPEALIDLYWHERNIEHEFQVPIGQYIADWVLEGRQVVEYAGFSASPRWGKAYRARLREKVGFYTSEGWEVRVIWPQDLKEYDLGFRPKPCRDLRSNGVVWSEQPLGQMLDTALAKHLGVTQSTVTRWRQKLGIPRYHA